MRTLTTHAHAAKLIRAEMKDKFKGVTFRVVSERYAGGNSVRVYWIDGPTRKEVEKITDKYQYGHFDGMTDSYEHSNVNKDLPQVKFTFAERGISDEVFQAVFDLYLSKVDTFENVTSLDESVLTNGRCTTARQEAWRYITKLDLREPLTAQRIHNAQFGE